MGGPTLTLLYRQAEQALLELKLAGLPGTKLTSRPSTIVVNVASAVIPRIVHRGETEQQPRSCEYTFTFEPSWLVSADRATQRAVTTALGFLPAVELASYAAERTGVSPDGLWWLQENIIAAIGGWYEFRKVPKGVKDFVEVEVVDREAFFGKGPVDPAYLAEYEPYLPRSKLYFVDARATGHRELDY